MKRIVSFPVAIGITAGAIVGFFLGAMVTRHGEPAVVIRNATDETPQQVSIMTNIGRSYRIHELQPPIQQLCECHRKDQWHWNVGATTSGGKELSSEKVYVASQGVVFALVSSDGFTLQYER